MTDTERMINSYIGRRVDAAVRGYGEDSSYTICGDLVAYDPPWIAIKEEDGVTHYNEGSLIWLSPRKEREAGDPPPPAPPPPPRS